MRDFVINWIKQIYETTINGEKVFNKSLYDSHTLYWSIGMLVVLGVIFLIVWHLFKFILVKFSHSYFQNNTIRWDNYLVNNKVFKALAYLIPTFFVDYFLSIVFYEYPVVYSIFSKLTSVVIILFLIITFNRLLVTLKDILLEKESFKDKPIQSYVQVIQIVLTIILVAVMISVLTGVRPINLLASFGAASAILILVFKDTILGFVGSIQLGGNDIVRIGDWITMDKFGADGTVEEINLTTVKVRNFDRTITTIPTYLMVSDSFKNWRGMQESDGRRIKRSIKININSIKYAETELIEKLKNFTLIKDYLEEKELEIAKYNEKNGFVNEKAIGGRRQTNIGIFRKYMEFYIRSKPEINNKMSIYVRQLEPTDTGLPLEIYCFTKAKHSLEYEAIQSDIFDHIFAIIGEFELCIFEYPSGNDMKLFNINS
ncbi:MAG: mechanosensitive ion channel family protein [Crocinitomicaceae bacterium]|nr:mechanosensitive ion channel family protein [Crocinitomicaceae bacterium]